MEKREAQEMTRALKELTKHVERQNKLLLDLGRVFEKWSRPQTTIAPNICTCGGYTKKSNCPIHGKKDN